MQTASLYIESMKTAFPNFYVELQSHAIKKFDDDAFPTYLELLDNEDFIRDNLIELAEITDTPMVLYQ